MRGFLSWLLKMQRNKKCIQCPDFQWCPCIFRSSPLRWMIEDCEPRMWRTPAQAGVAEITIQVVTVPWAFKGKWPKNPAVGFVLLYFSVLVKNHDFWKAWAYFLLLSVCPRLESVGSFPSFLLEHDLIPYGFCAVLILSINNKQLYSFLIQFSALSSNSVEAHCSTFQLQPNTLYFNLSLIPADAQKTRLSCKL